MRQVPVAEFKDNASAWIAAAEAGEEIVITRHGKPAARLTAAAEDRKAAQRAAVDALFEAGRARRARGDPSISSDEIVVWIKEDQR
nr:type II toxin-antitoxin system prevent-host-death family antitoxin [Polymorphobacter sp.]